MNSLSWFKLGGTKYSFSRGVEMVLKDIVHTSRGITLKLMIKQMCVLTKYLFIRRKDIIYVPDK